MQRRTLLVTLATLSACAGPRTSRDVAGDSPRPHRLGDVQVQTANIYEAEDTERSWLARIVNATHWRTREAVVRRELWLREGDAIGEADARELERNLRATGLFAEVAARLVPDPTDPERTDLVVETRDQLSLGGGASGSFIGGVASLGTSFSESNLFGTGDRIAVAFSENSEDEFRGAVSYRDRHFLGTWIEGRAQVGRTEEGDFAGVGLSRPFKFLADRRAWSLSASTTESERDYFQGGDTVAEVPQQSDAVDASVAWRHGPEHAYWTTGLLVDHNAVDYGAAVGPAAATIDVPGDTTRTLLAATLGRRTISGFREVRRLDTLGFVQDVTLGTSTSLQLGGQRYDEEGEDDRVEPVVALSSAVTAELAEDSFASARLTGRVRTRAGDAQGWSASAQLHAFELGFEPHTLAARLAYDEADEEVGLPVQFVLGEGQGLRGYPAREFTGERVLRLNLEDRIQLGGRIGSIDVGAVAFFDMAWIEDRGEGFGRPYKSLGVGLRFGSDALLGNRVIRLDLAFPLDEVDGERLDPLVSLALGQVFGL